MVIRDMDVLRSRWRASRLHRPHHATQQRLRLQCVPDLPHPTHDRASLYHRKHLPMPG